MTEQLTDEQLNSVTGGNNPYQLFYNGQSLTMTSTVAQICQQHPELQGKLGILYGMVADKTLNELCEQYGESFVQGLINANS